MADASSPTLLHPTLSHAPPTLLPTPPAQVRAALDELMRGVVGDELEACAGGGAPLFELAALVSAPGAHAQPLHADTLWCDAHPLCALGPPPGFLVLQPGCTRLQPLLHAVAA